MTQHPDNAKRAERATKGLPVCERDREDNLRDLLTDLRHYCDTHGIDFWKQDSLARDNYLCELRDPTL